MLTKNNQVKSKIQVCFFSVITGFILNSSDFKSIVFAGFWSHIDPGWLCFIINKSDCVDIRLDFDSK